MFGNGTIQLDIYSIYPISSFLHPHQNLKRIA